MLQISLKYLQEVFSSGGKNLSHHDVIWSNITLINKNIILKFLKNSNFSCRTENHVKLLKQQHNFKTPNKFSCQTQAKALNTQFIEFIEFIAIYYFLFVHCDIVRLFGLLVANAIAYIMQANQSRTEKTLLT